MAASTFSVCCDDSDPAIGLEITISDKGWTLRDKSDNGKKSADDIKLSYEQAFRLLSVLESNPTELYNSLLMRIGDSQVKSAHLNIVRND